MATAPLVPSWYCTACCPLRNTALPVTEMQLNTLPPLPCSIRSPMRPPHPLRAPSGWSLCQVLCWSLCENSLAGSRTDLAWYCATVVGCTSGPTLSCTASRPLSNSVFSGASDGASAYCKPEGRATEGASVVAASASRAMARLPRMRL